MIEKIRVNEIVVLHGEICGLLKMSITKAIRIGQLLIEQKESLRHGEFGRWIEKNLPFSDRTARNYMKIYENRNLLKSENISVLSEGYKLLQGTSEPAKPKSLNDQISELRKRTNYLEIDAGKAIIELNKLLKPETGHSIVGTANEDVVFHIERNSLIVYKFRGKEPRHDFTERQYKFTDGDYWWWLDKHVGTGRITAIWEQPEIEITAADLERFGTPADSGDQNSYEKYKVSMRKLQNELQVSEEIINNIITSILPNAESRLKDAEGNLRISLNQLALESRKVADVAINELLMRCIDERQNFLDAFSAIFAEYGLPFVVNSEEICPGYWNA
ncbi:MAG: DUF3102 domain-containing protein [Sedimentisphaerales bacterium]